MGVFRTFLALALAAILAACQVPQHVEMTKELKRSSAESRIVLMPVNIELSELSAGGVLEPKADWTEAAKAHLTAAFREEQSARGSRLIDYDESQAPAERRDNLRQLFKLYGTVGQAIFNHQFAGPLRLPTKADGFNWSLGPSMRAMRDQYGADYALLTYVRDSYSSSGRQALKILGALAGIGISGGVQIAFMSLVDLDTGDIVWFSRVIKTTGDLRTADGARSEARGLLEGFPR
jgi:hypothetical protein